MNALFLMVPISATIFVSMLALLVRINKDTLAVQKRFSALKDKDKQLTMAEIVKKEQRRRIDDTKVKFLKKLGIELSLADLLIKPSEFLIIWACLTLIPPLFALFFGIDLIIALGISIIGLAVPPVFVYTKKNKRVETFEKQLVDAIGIMCNCLRSGLTFQQAIESISTEMPDPISKEFSRMIRELRLGNNIEKAFSNMSNRINSPDLKLMVSAVLIQRQTGGNLSEVLTNIAGAIKERCKIKNELKVLTATARTSGIVVGLIPVFMLLFFMLIKPDYIRLFFHTKIGMVMLITAAVLELIGFLFIRKIVNIKF